jgi:solute carrier family 35 protein F1/2
MYEVVDQLGFWATIINGIQLAILEREELKNITWAWPVIGCIIGFDIAMFSCTRSPLSCYDSVPTFTDFSLG